MNTLLRYFDLVSEKRPTRPQTKGEGKALHWLPQYVALLVGIVMQRFFQQYMATGSWSFTGFFGWFLASLILAISIFPAAYKHSFEPDKPLFVQLCVIFVAGMGWESLAGTALTTIKLG